MLPADATTSCPDCDAPPQPARRDFIRVLGASAAAAAVAGLTPLQKARAARAAKQREAEALVFELYGTMSAEQKKKLVLPWDAGSKGGLPARLMTHNAAAVKDSVIGLGYEKKQVEILKKLFQAISNGEDGYKKLSRNNKFDNSGDFENIGALIYGEPAEGKKFSLVFAGHHLTVRCDGDSEEKTAFGGPLYYGHTPNGYSPTNVFFSQTKASLDMFNALDAKQRGTALLDGKWMDEHGRMKTPGKDAKLPGISVADLAKDQKAAVEMVMKELVSPYRKEDGDEVMEIVKANGGLEKLSLAFYKEGQRTEKEPWTYWRLEGPGFVWSYRALPHIHTFVYINSKL
ncbi:MAG: hypothetical protein C0501_21675 [Isosphaera sp.]|nr:hypothetical protein [Isosphaera sp.]